MILDPMIRAWTASLLLHLLLAGVVLTLDHHRVQPRPLVRIDLQLVPARTQQPLPSPAAAKLDPVTQGAPPKPPSPVVKRPTKPPPARPEPPKVSAPAQAVAAAPVVETLPPPPAATVIAPGTSAPEVTASATPAPGLPQQQAPKAEIQGEAYLSTQFNHIRDQIMAALRYPLMARRQGWRGQVRVEFTILMSGSIQDLRVSQSSGYPILDKQALRAVEAAQPFPPPPAVATITLPVNFQLD